MDNHSLIFQIPPQKPESSQSLFATIEASTPSQDAPTVSAEAAVQEVISESPSEVEPTTAPSLFEELTAIAEEIEQCRQKAIV